MFESLWSPSNQLLHWSGLKATIVLARESKQNKKQQERYFFLVLREISRCGLAIKSKLKLNVITVWLRTQSGTGVTDNLSMEENMAYPLPCHPSLKT